MKHPLTTDYIAEQALIEVSRLQRLALERKQHGNHG